MSAVTMAAAAMLGLSAAACRGDMYDQARADPLEPSALFADGMSARPPVVGTVARGFLREDDAFYSGRVNGVLVARMPVPLTRALMERGGARYGIFCSPCHGAVGDGEGMIVKRGFPRPPSLHVDRLRQAPDGHIYDVITRGFGAMYDYAAQILPADRWAIAAHVRVLQRSRNARLGDVPAADRASLLPAQKAPGP